MSVKLRLPVMVHSTPPRSAQPVGHAEGCAVVCDLMPPTCAAVGLQGYNHGQPGLWPTPPK